MPSNSTTESSFTAPRFSNEKNKAFAQDLKTAINTYFETQQIKRSGGIKFLLKIPVVLAIYLIPYSLILFGNYALYTQWFFALIMGIGIATIGLVVMHDANHKNATSNYSLNKFLTYSMSFLGGSPVLWRIQHNVLHHTYTNIEGCDEDLDAISLLRFSPNSAHKKIHRFQHIYAWFFYSLLTISWAGHDDYIQLKRYNKMGLLKSQNTTYTKEVWGITLTKLSYFGYLVIIPIIFTNLHWWQVIIGFVSMHLVAGLLLSLIFQAAHVTPTAEFLDKTHIEIEENNLVHQLQTTKNFAMKSRWFTWIVGGLNYQVEHHLFPHISHVHYRKLAPIVQQITTKHNIPYQQAKTFSLAVKAHFIFLKKLGKA